MNRFAASLLVLLFSASTAGAAVTPGNFVAPQTPRMQIATFTQGIDPPGTNKPLYTGGVNGSKCTFVVATSSDASAHQLAFLVFKAGGSSMTLAAPNVPAYAGASSPPTVLFGPSNSLGYPSDSDGNPYIFLQAGDQFLSYYTTALGAGGSLQVQAQCADF